MQSVRQRLPPGIAHFGASLPTFLLHAATAYVTLAYIVPTITNMHLPIWASAFLSFFAHPVVYTLKWTAKPYIDARKARARGMVMPPYIPGNQLQVMQRFGDASQAGYMGQALYEWILETGQMTVAHRFYNDEVIYTLEPEHIKTILATQFDSFEKGAMFTGQMESLLGSGIFNTDGEMWKFHRAMTRPFFTRERISDFHIYDRNSAQTLAVATKRLEQGYSIDFQDLVGRFTFDSATEFLCGQNVGSLTADLPYPPSVSVPPESTPRPTPLHAPASGVANLVSQDNHPSERFIEAFSKAQKLAGGRSAWGRDWPAVEFWKDEVKPLRSLLDDFTKPLLEQALDARRENGPASAKEELCLLAYLVKHTQDMRILQDELVNLLVAGRDTTASLLSFSFYMLCEHPQIERRLRQEIFEKIGPNDPPTYDHMREMKYMRAFLNEVLRLYPPVPVNNRMANHPMSLPCKNGPPIYVPANTGCAYSVMYMQRRTDLWGPDALKFDPDRFLDHRLHEYLTPNPYIFCPFNAGPRICIGQQFAYHEATFFLVRLLQNFSKFELDHAENLPPHPEWSHLAHRGGSGSEYADKIRIGSYLTMFIQGGLWIKMKPYKREQEV